MEHARNTCDADDKPFLDTFTMTQKLYSNVEAGMDPICVTRGEAKDNVVATSEFIYQYSTHACLWFPPACLISLTNVALGPAKRSPTSLRRWGVHCGIKGQDCRMDVSSLGNNGARMEGAKQIAPSRIDRCQEGTLDQGVLLADAPGKRCSTCAVPCDEGIAGCSPGVGHDLSPAPRPGQHQGNAQPEGASLHRNGQSRCIE